MLSVSQLHKSIGHQDLFTGVSFLLARGEKVALVGANGTGKSTLMRICSGEVEAGGGEISLPKDVTVGYLPQHADLDSDLTLGEELRTVFGEVDANLAELEELAHRMAEVDHDSEEYVRIAERYGHLQHEVDRLGVYEVDATIDRIAGGLGFGPGDRGRPCREFSGGWQMRILLGRLLLRNPEVLLLDEPTNHLDLETMIWLESWIRESDSAVLLVSHERKFMDALATRTFEIHAGQLSIYRGNYTKYLQTRLERWEQWRREYVNQQLEIERLQRFIDRFRYNNVKAPLVQSRIKQLDKIKRIPTPPREDASIHFRFPAPVRGSKEVYTLHGVKKKYDDLLVFDDADLSIWRGEKVGLVGLNGAGKSTLLRLLAGRETATGGRIEKGSKVQAEYFGQYDTDGLGLENTVMGEIATVAPPGHLEQARRLLGGFFFSGPDAEKLVGVLSGGERTRLRLAKMLFSGANVLLLDEPTNHLDIASRKTLEGALVDYEGTVLIVSHDRTFLDAVTTRIIEIKDGRVRSFPGNYSDYARALGALGERSPLVDAPTPASALKKGKSTRADEKLKPSVEAEAGNMDSGKAGKKAADKASAPESDAPITPLKKGIAHQQASKDASREERRLRKLVIQLEVEIEKSETRLAELQAELIKPEVYRDHTRSAPLMKERTTLREHHETYMSQWEKQIARLESSLA